MVGLCLQTTCTLHTTHLPWAVDRNLLPGAPIVIGTGANGLPTNGSTFQDWGAPQCLANPGLCFADPTRTILQKNEYASVANAVYHGGILEVKKRFTNHLALMANYTYSKAIDDSTDFNSDYSAFNEVGLAAERALSDFDQRHKVVFAAVVESPWQNSRVLSGFELAPVISYNSGHPFNLLAGADINGDNHFTNDRPPGASAIVVLVPITPLSTCDCHGPCIWERNGPFSSWRKDSTLLTAPKFPESTIL